MYSCILQSYISKSANKFGSYTIHTLTLCTTAKPCSYEPHQNHMYKIPLCQHPSLRSMARVTLKLVKYGISVLFGIFFFAMFTKANMIFPYHNFAEVFTQQNTNGRDPPSPMANTLKEVAEDHPPPVPITSEEVAHH